MEHVNMLFDNTVLLFGGSDLCVVIFTSFVCPRDIVFE